MEWLLMLFVVCVLVGALLSMPGEGWIVVIVILLTGYFLIARANACEEHEHEAPYCWQQQDGQIFCENQ